MACDNEFCDPEIGNDCAECFARRTTPLTLSQALKVRSTPDFQVLEARIAAAYQVIDATYDILHKSYPLENGYYWLVYGRLCELRLMPVFEPPVES